MATPRRLFLAVDDLAERQDDQVIEKLGPARSVAFDDAGNPSKAALGFARGQCIDVNALEFMTTEKGEYICARKKITGEATEGLLPAILTTAHHRHPLPQVDALVGPGDPLRPADPLDPRPLRRPNRSPSGSETSKAATRAAAIGS